MARKRYTLLQCIDEGLDYKAENILNEVKKLFKRYDDEIKAGNSSDAATTIMEIKDKLFDVGGS